MKEILIIGAGGHAKVLISIIKKSKMFHPIGYTDIHDKGLLLGIRYLGKDDILEGVIKNKRHFAAAIGLGTVGLDHARIRVFETLERLGFVLPVIVSPQAIVNEDVKIGMATVICDGVVVQPGTSIGRAVILNTKCSVDHDCEIGDFSHIAPGAILSGGVRVGKNCLIGTGAAVIQGVRICENCVIGAGATVIDNIDEYGIYVGSPARKIK